MKHIKHWLATMAMLLCSITASAHDFEVGGIYYNITSEEDLTVAVTYQGSSYNQYSNEYSGAVTIPSTVTYNSKTYNVTSIGFAAFGGCSSLTSITIPESVTSIGDDAFFYCSSLTAITLPESVTSIGGSAFYGCSSLTAITIPESVTSIGNYAFRECRSLTSITCEAITPPALEGSWVFFSVDKSIPVYVPAESVGEYRSTEGWRDFTNIIGMETSIENVENSEFTIQNSTLIYDLHGRCVAHPTKGIYIVNGRKIVIK